MTARKISLLAFTVFVIYTLFSVYQNFNELLSNFIPFTDSKVSSGNSLQENLYLRSPILVKEIIDDPLADSKIADYLSGCNFHMPISEPSFTYDMGYSKCLFVFPDYTYTDESVQAITRSVISSEGILVSYAFIFPSNLSDISLKTIIYHEAVHMVDLIENPGCSESELVCTINYEFHAHSKSLVLFQDYMVKNGFTTEQLSKVNIDSKTDPIMSFISKNSISEDDYRVKLNSIVLLKEYFSGNLRDYLTALISSKSYPLH